MSHLTSEQIGAIGESRVHHLCILAKLEATKPDPDRTGKDLIIEWPLAPPSDDAPYDMRPAPRACIAQVKSVLPGTKHVELKLSAAERLIRDPRPAFLLVARLDQDSDDAQVVEIGVLHLRGAPLGRILKRLRKESARGETKINEKMMSFKIAGMTSVKPSASALRPHLETCIGSDMGAHTAAKEQELKTLGFDDHPIKMNVTFAPATFEDLVRRSLDGLPLTASNIELTHVRFGIPLPGVPGMPANLCRSAGVITIEAKAQPCQLIIESAGAEDQLIMSAELIFPPFPSLPDEVQLHRVRTPLIELTMGNKRLNLRMREEELEQTWPLDVWANSFLLYSLLMRGGSAIKIKFKDTVARFAIDSINDRGGSNLAQWTPRERHFSKLLQIVQAVPGCPMPSGRYEDFVRLEYRMVCFAHATVLGSTDVTGLSFETNHDLPATDLDNMPFLIVSQLDLGDVSIGIAQRAVLSVGEQGTDLLWTALGAIDFLSAEPFAGETNAAYEAFKQKVMRVSGIERYVDPGFYTALSNLDRAA